MAKIVVVYAERTDDAYVAHFEHEGMKTMSCIPGPTLNECLDKAHKWSEALGGIEVWVRHRNGSVYQDLGLFKKYRRYQ